MPDTPFSPWPDFTDEEAESVKQVLLSNRVNYWTGPECRDFEAEFAEWCGASHAIALANGTVALELILHGLGITTGDEVIVTPRTFIASVSCIVAVGATPVFAEIDPDSQNICAETISRVLTEKTRAVICVHLAGWPCEMDAIMALSEQHNFFVVEDCAQAHGATYKGVSVGSIGHAAAWSFCQDKIMTTGGEGGMVTTNDRGLWEKMWAYKDHGKSYDAVYHRHHPPGYRWLHESFGSNLRMTGIQAAIGRIQLRRMSSWHQSRTLNAEKIISTCEQFPHLLRAPRQSADIEHAWYKCYVFVRKQSLSYGWTRDRIMESLNDQGVACYSGTCSEVYLEKAFDATGWRPAERLPVARELGESSLMFLVHPTLTKSEITKTCSTITSVMSLVSSS
jgi:dTDP-4-amino-4,6-dideoxygalactose transaminase